ncbi:hypothetical protein Ocin01_14496 [Orchesella cincta]|uniref:Uncharacterized protein n=1 Tax=Orchesella cincta TaxID=48709 RepID=A0A1D2MGQ1_ORCCI|nr:hypothetical protein Ocin01_14496 [Orchesella cincta]
MLCSLSTSGKENREKSDVYTVSSAHQPVSVLIPNQINYSD